VKEFKISSWAIDNKTSIYVLTLIITLAGILSYISLPKEQFPEIVFPQIIVSSIYPGAAPTDIENNVTKHIEKQVKSIAGIKKVTSNSVQDFSLVIIEFNTDVNVAAAKILVKDAVDKAKKDLPKGLLDDPSVMEVDVSQVPIMNINISGDFELSKLKDYSEIIQDKIESMKEIRRVDMIGALEREIQINVDRYKMENANITMTDIENSVKYENITISGGTIKMDNVRRSLSVKGEFKSVQDIANTVVRSGSGAKVYLKDIAEVKDTYEEKESFARLNHKPVITLNVIKRGGENLIDASDKIRTILKDLQDNKFPEKLNITITGDQSTKTRITLHDLINTIIIGFILVVIILMFFMGTTNAIFVGLSVPLSMFIAFMLMPTLGFTLNMIVLFSFLLALGIVVDDAIVVVENTHRIFDNGKVPIVKAAKQAAGEVFMPVLSGTLTTIAPFIPLVFWKGVIGKFMFFLPVTLIVTLFASLIVAYIMNPVFAVDFMKPHTDEDHQKSKITKGFIITVVVFVVIALLAYIGGNVGIGNLSITMLGLYCLNKFVLTAVIKNFQDNTWPRFQTSYSNVLRNMLQGWRPVYMLAGTVGLLFFTIWFMGVRKPGVVFFPQSEPNFAYTYISLPVGTNQAYTDSITSVVENRIFGVLGENNPVVQSVISNVAVGAGDPSDPESNNVQPHKGKVTVAFVEFEKRHGQSTSTYLSKIRDAVKGIPGAEITVDQEKGGPPTGKPVNIEIKGDDFEQIIASSDKLKKFINALGIDGIEELKSDLVKNKPEVVIEIDRERANTEGIFTGQIGGEIRKAVFGQEVSKFREAGEEYPIQLRYQYTQRNDIEALLNTKITYRDMNLGGIIRQVPLSSIAHIKYANTYGGIKHKNEKRMITLSSNVLTGYNANEIVNKIQQALPEFQAPQGVEIKMTGEQEEQKETGAFLGMAGLIAIGLIFIILVTQFNSISKPIIIISEIVFSIIGVLLGFSIFKMDISIIMTGIGIVALAGIVVRNGILLVEFTHHLEEQGLTTLEAIIEAGRTRMTPVLLTATATILGLIPLAVGLNIDFVKLFTELNPHLFFGGDSVAFWGPLSWTMIFGLAFATLLTLFLVPAMYLLTDKLKRKLNIGHKIIVKPTDI
jgi:multidrug efflux pump